MRRSVLLLIASLGLSLVFATICVAQNAVAPAKTNLADSTGDSGAIIHLNKLPAYNFGSEPDLTTPYQSPVCFTMRTYVVVRDDSESDATHIGGYHECLPSWKLNLRSSQKQEDAPKDR